MIERMRTAYRALPHAWNTALIALVGIVLIALDTTGLWLASDAGTASRWWHLAPLLVGAALLLAQRRAPVRVLLGVTALSAVDLVLGGSIGMLLVFFDALYSAVLRTTPSRRRALLIAIVAVTLFGGTGATIASGGDVRSIVVVCLQLVALLSTPYAWAAAVREGRDRLDAQARLGEARREEAVREERAAMARDLHDTLSGELAAVAIHAEAGLENHGRERAALEAVRAAGIAGLEQTRAMIRVLRAEDEALTAPGRLEQLPALVERTRLAGLEVSVEGQAPALPVAVDQAAARILQESLTNALKHAAGGAVRIRLDASPDALLLVIASSGGAPAVLAAGDGLGVAMMHERADALGGWLTAGPEGDGWRVVAELPRRAGG